MPLIPGGGRKRFREAVAPPGGEDTTLRDVVGHLLVDIPPTFTVDDISASHPRFIDVTAFEAKIRDSSYSNYYNSGQSAIQKLIAAGNAGDPVANGLLYRMDPTEDTGQTASQRLASAKATVLAGSYTRDAVYWNQNPLAVPAMLGLYAYDLIADQLTSGERTIAWGHIMALGNRNTSTFRYEGVGFAGMEYFVAGAHYAAFSTYNGVWFGWWVLMAFAHDGVADALIEAEIDAVIDGTTADIQSPWDIVNASYVMAGENGGSYAGMYDAYGGSYYGLFCTCAPHMLDSMDQACGTDLVSKYTLTTKQPRNYHYDSGSYNIDEQGIISMCFVSGISADANDRAAAKWFIDNFGYNSPYGFMTKMLLDDRRVTALSPSAAGYPINPKTTAGGELWASMAGHNVRVTDGDTRVRLCLRRKDIEREEADCGAMAIYRGTTPITAGTDRAFQTRNVVMWSCQHIREGVQGLQYTSYSGFGRSGASRCKLPNTALDDARYFTASLATTQSGSGWESCLLDTTNSHYAEQFTLSLAKRCVIHLVAKDVVIIWDRIDAGNTIAQAIVWRHVDAPVIVGNNWTIAGAKFMALGSGYNVSWVGGLNNEQKDVFTGAWLGVQDAGYVPGYSSDVNKKNNSGLGSIAIKPDSYASSNIYWTVCDVQDQYADAVLVGNTVTIDGVAVTVNSNGTVSVS